MSEKENPAGQGGALEETAGGAVPAADGTGPESASSTLSAAHVTLLAKRGISQSYLDRHPKAFRSYDADTMLPAGFGWVSGTSAANGGIVVAWPQLDDSAVLQLRPDAPVTGQSGPIKYVSPGKDGSKTLVYGILKRSTVDKAPVYLVEGTFQSRAAAAALCDTDATVVGIPGITSLVAGLPADLSAAVLFRGRPVYIVVDADAATNRAVYDAAKTTGDRLTADGAAKVRYLQVPAVAGPSTGLDDYLGTLDESARSGELQALAAVALTKPAPAAPKRKSVKVASDDTGSDSGGPQAFGLSWTDLWGEDGGDLHIEVAAKAILKRHPAARTITGDLAWYRDGVYVPADPRKDTYFLSVVGRLLGDRTTTGNIANIRARVEGLVSDSGRVIPEEPTEPVVNHQGGLFDLRTGESRPHTPDHLSIQQLAVSIDPDMPCPTYDEWIEGRVGAEQAIVIDALMAATLDPSRLCPRVGFLFGPTRSGKSTLLRLIRAIFGAALVAGVTLQHIEKSQFAAAELHGKAINLAADLSSAELRDLSGFKTLSGDDVIFASKKYGAAFSYRSRATMMFSANTPPCVPADDAYFARMLALSFPKSFVGEEDSSIEERMMEELPGIVARWIRAYGQRPVEHPAVGEVFRGQSDRVARFMAEATVPCSVDVEPGVELPSGSLGTVGAATSSEIYAAFKAWAEAEGGREMGRNTLTRRLEALGVNRIVVGAKSNKKVLDIRLLDVADHVVSHDPHEGLIDALWPTGSAPTPTSPVPVSPAPAAPTLSVTAADLAARFAQPALDEGFWRAVLDVAAIGTDASAGAPVITLADLTAASPVTDPYWVRSIVSSAGPALSAAGIHFRERRLGLAGDLGSYDPATTGRFVSTADQAELKRKVEAARAAAAAAKKAGDPDAAGLRDTAEGLALNLASARGLPHELTAYAVVIDPSIDSEDA